MSNFNLGWVIKEKIGIVVINDYALKDIEILDRYERDIAFGDRMAQKDKLCKTKKIILIRIKYDEPLTKTYIKKKLKQFI